MVSTWNYKLSRDGTLTFAIADARHGGLGRHINSLTKAEITSYLKVRVP